VTLRTDTGTSHLRAAFDAFYDRHFPRIYAFVLRRVRDEREAQAVTRDVLTAVATALERETDPGALLRDTALTPRVLRLTLGRLHRSARRTARVRRRPPSPDASAWGRG